VFFDSSSYSLSVYAVPLLLFGALNTALGVATLVRERASAVSLAFFAMTMAIAVWLLSTGAIYLSDDREVAFAWIKVDYFGVAFIPTTILLFALAVTDQLRTRRLAAVAAMVASIAFFWVFEATDLMLAGSYHYSWGYYAASGEWIPLYLLYFGAVLGISQFLLLSCRRQTRSPANRRRLQALAIALGTAYLASGDFLPTFGVPVYPVGYLFIGGFTVLSARAIWRDRLVDITPALAAKQIVRTMGDGVLLFDRDGVVRVANEAVADIFGTTPSSLVGEPVAAIDANWFDGALAPLIALGSVERAEIAYRRAGDQEGTLQVTASKIADRGVDWLATACIVHDITERKAAEEALRESEMLYRTLVETSPDAVIFSEPNGRILMVNGRAAEILGLDDPAELRGRNAMELVADDDRERLRDSFVKSGGSLVGRDVEYTLVRTDGSRFPAELSASRVPGADGETRAIIAVARDITARRLAEETIRRLAFHDALTGVANRPVLMDRLPLNIAQARRNRTSVGLLFLDLDGFKQVNDLKGHDAGDRLLQRVAGELGEMLRESDTLARVGGDEFVMVLSGIAGEKDAAAVAARVLEKLAPDAPSEDWATPVSVSIGIATFPRDALDPETLLRNADFAMYEAKRDGGNRYRLFSHARADAAQRLAS
jgi:diguanylate cyclase (GGDEF)-like protein/PAS domain S-box-containing protein